MRVIVICLSLLCVFASAIAVPVSQLETRQALAEGLRNVQQQMLSLTTTVTQHTRLEFGASHAKLLAVHEKAAGFHSAFHSLAQPSSTCASALFQLNATIASTSCQSILGAFGNNPLSNPSALVASLTAVCTSTCLQLLANASAAVTLGCQSADAAALTTDITQVISYSNLLCVKDPAKPNNYCFAEIAGALATVETNPSAITTAELNALCVPCTYTIVNGFIAYGAISAGASANLTAVSLFCSTDPVTGQYCVPELQQSVNVISSISSTNVPTLTDAEFEPICSSCTKKFLTYSANPAASAALTALCVTNGNDFCLVKSINNLQGFLTNIGGNTCSATSAYVNAVGCCITPMVALLNSLSIPLSFSSLFNLCNITVPSTCPVPSYNGNFTFVISNIAYSYYLANTTAVTSAIVLDILTNLGLSASQVTVSSVVAFTDPVTGTQAGIQVTFSVSFISTLQSTTCVGEFTTNIKAGNFPLPSTAQLGPSARISPASPVATSTSNVQATSTAPTYTTAAPGTSTAPQQASFSTVVLFAMPIVALLFSNN